MNRHNARVVCIGGVAIDRKYHASSPVQMGTSNPFTSTRSFGGVARNIAENISRLGLGTSLVSVVGEDENGRALMAGLAELGVDTRHVAVSSNHATAEYAAILQPDGNLAIGLADMTIFNELTPDRINAAWLDLSPGWVFADCNLPSTALNELIELAREHSAMLVLDAVSTLKVVRLPRDLSGVGVLFVNQDEARAFLGDQALPRNKAALALVGCGAKQVVLTLGQEGLIAADGQGLTRLGAAQARIIDATGAGDALISATLVGLLNGASLVQAARYGTISAALTIECAASVRSDLSLALLESELWRSAPPSFEREPS